MLLLTEDGVEVLMARKEDSPRGTAGDAEGEMEDGEGGDCEWEMKIQGEGLAMLASDGG